MNQKNFHVNVDHTDGKTDRQEGGEDGEGGESVVLVEEESEHFSYSWKSY